MLLKLKNKQTKNFPGRKSRYILKKDKHGGAYIYERDGKFYISMFNI